MKMSAGFTKTTCAAALVFGTLAVSPALAEWRGSAVVRTHTAACATGGTYTTGAIVNARYRLPNLLGNGSETRLTFYDRYYGFAVKRVGTFSSAFVPAVGTGFGSGGAFQWAQTPTVRMVSRTPAVVVATTPFVNLQIQITNFDEILGCTVTIDVSVFKR